MFRRTFALIGSIALCGCEVGPDYTGTYVADDDISLMQLNLVEAGNGQINATLSVSSLNYKKGKIDTITGGMTGIRDGSTIGLLSSNGTGGSMTLKGDGDQLIWQVPDTGQSIAFAEMDQVEYQEKVLALNSRLLNDELLALSEEE